MKNDKEKTTTLYACGEDRIVVRNGEVYLRGDHKLIPPEEWKKWTDAGLERLGVTREALLRKEAEIRGEIEPVEEADTPTKIEIKASDEKEAIIKMSQIDEEQILSELQGKVLDSYVYQIPRKDRVDYHLTYVGIKTIIQKMGGISIQDVVVTETDKTYRAKAIVYDKKRDNQTIGVAEQSKTMVENGVVKDDPFALQKCVSKAIRNAYRMIIPEFVAKKMIEEWISMKQQGG